MKEKEEIIELNTRYLVTSPSKKDDNEDDSCDQ